MVDFLLPFGRPRRFGGSWTPLSEVVVARIRVEHQIDGKMGGKGGLGLEERKREEGSGERR